MTILEIQLLRLTTCAVIRKAQDVLKTVRDLEQNGYAVNDLRLITNQIEYHLNLLMRHSTRCQRRISGHWHQMMSKHHITVVELSLADFDRHRDQMAA